MKFRLSPIFCFLFPTNSLLVFENDGHEPFLPLHVPIHFQASPNLFSIWIQSVPASPHGLTRAQRPARHPMIASLLHLGLIPFSHPSIHHPVMRSFSLTRWMKLRGRPKSAQFLCDIRWCRKRLPHRCTQSPLFPAFSWMPSQARPAPLQAGQRPSRVEIPSHR